MQSIRWYQKIQFQIPIAVFLIILIPSAVFWLYNAEKSRQRSIFDAVSVMESRLSESSYLLMDSMEEIENASRAFLEQQDFSDLMTEFFNAPDNARARSRILLSMGQTIWPVASAERMYLAGKNCPLILTSDPEEKILTSESQAFLNQGSPMGTTTWKPFPVGEKSEAGIAYWRSLSSPSYGDAGSLICVMKPEVLSRAVSGMVSLTGSAGVIHTYTGEILYSSGPEGAVSSLLSSFDGSEAEYGEKRSWQLSMDDSKWLAVSLPSLENGLQYTMALPLSRVTGSFPGRDSLLLLAVAGIAAVAFGSVIFFFLVARPLGVLEKKMEAMESGQLETLAVSGPENEIGRVLRAYNQMIVRLKKLIDEVYVQQLLRKQAQLSSLQSQMDEHFLYNTLNTIYYQAQEENASSCASMILMLSRYFRLSLSDGQEKIPLTSIADLIRTYLQIQQYRYGQTLTCHIKLLPDMDQYLSLKHLYQPIIENAIIHGFEKKLGTHSLEICFAKDGDALLFSVKDDGTGFPRETLEEIMAPPDSMEPSSKKGYALRSIREQIRIAYGDAYGITIESAPGEGAFVELRLPLERRSEWKDNTDC